MISIDNKYHLEKAITVIDSMMITNKEYVKLVKISNHIRKQIEHILNCNINNIGFIKLYIEERIRNILNKLIYTNTETEIIIANILLPDDIKITELLNLNEYTIEELKTIIRFRSLLKNIMFNSNTLDNELEQQLNIYKTYTNKLIILFQKEFNINDETIIINRICDLIVRHPNYFNSKHITNIKKR